MINALSPTDLDLGHDSRLQTINPIGVLLADPHQIIREGLRQEINRQNDIDVLGETGDGQETIQLAQTLCPHVIVLDINLARVGGIQVVRRLNLLRQQESINRHPHILVFSSYKDKQYIWSMLAAGVRGYLLKSDMLDTVIAGIRAVATGQTVLNQQVQSTLLRYIPELHQDLSQTELSVIKLVAKGLSDEEIADQLKITQNTVQSHIYNTYRKIPWVRSRAEAAAWARINRVVHR
jgi:DNA-binding NarL/FixJ family response regulator